MRRIPRFEAGSTRRQDVPSRVKRTFDFTSIRESSRLDNLDAGARKERLQKLLNKKLKAGAQRSRTPTRSPRPGEGRERRPLDQLGARGAVRRARAARADVRRPTTAPTSPAFSGERKARCRPKRRGRMTSQRRRPRLGRRHVPGHQALRLPRARADAEGTEFAIIAALQYIRYLNERNSFMTIHGANLSLSIPHDVRNFACGRTPICNECERLVDSGVVVVAAAGNRGYQNFETTDGVVRGLRGVQHHRSGQCRRRDHRRRHAPLLAAHLRRQLLLEPRPDRRRPAQAGSRRAGRAHPRAAARQRDGAISTAPAWRRRTSAAPRRC